MIVCKVCGTENEQGAGFCGSCGAFLEWNSEAVAADGTPVSPDTAPTAPLPTPPAPVPGPAPVPTAPTPVPGPTATPAVDPSLVVCPACGEANEPTRVFCRRCATELAPAPAATDTVIAEPPRARSVPPVAILGGLAAVLLLGAVAAFALLPKETPTPSSGAGQTVPPSNAPSNEVPSDGSTPSDSPPVESVPPTPAPLTGRVVFSAEEDGNFDVYVWDPADDSVTPLVTGSRDQSDPSWSPGGSEVVYRDPRGLRMVDADGDPAEPPDFTHHAQDRHPAWSPDGEVVVFATDRDPFNSLNIVTRPADDNQAALKVLVNNGADDWDPAWSPDSSRIAFVSKRLGDAHLFVMNADGSNEDEIELGDGIFDDPAFSPDGEWLAFTRRDDGDSPKHLYVARSDGSEMRQLTDGSANDNDMAWSPDGRVLAVARSDDAARIVLIDVASGDELGSFGVDGATNRQPDWSRP